MTDLVFASLVTFNVCLNCAEMALDPFKKVPSHVFSSPCSLFHRLTSVICLICLISESHFMLAKGILINSNFSFQFEISNSNEGNCMLSNGYSKREIVFGFPLNGHMLYAL